MEVVYGCSSHYTLTSGRFARRQNAHRLFANLINPSQFTLFILSILEDCPTLQGLTLSVPEDAQIMEVFSSAPPLPYILKGAEDTCTDRTWWITKADTERTRNKNKHALMRRSVHLSCQSRCASDVLSEEACRSSEQPERRISYFFHLRVGFIFSRGGFWYLCQLICNNILEI